MRALIIGAAGQDGPYLGQYLSGLGYEVWGAVHPLENWEIVQARAPQMKLISLDVCEPTGWSPLIDQTKPDEVYYLAGVSSAVGAERSPISTIQTNYHGLVYLFEAIKSYTRVLNASSCFIFGDKQHPPQSETTALDPHNLYALSKANAHQFIGIQRKKRFHAVNAILFNHESLWRPKSYLSRKVSNAAATKARIDLGNLDATRDWGWAGDYVRALHLLLQQATPLDACIGTGVPLTIEDWLSACFGYVGEDWHDYVGQDPAFFRPPDHFYADPYFINSLGWTPTVDTGKLAKMMVDADTRWNDGFSIEQMVEYERVTWLQ